MNKWVAHLEFNCFNYYSLVCEKCSNALTVHILLNYVQFVRKMKYLRLLSCLALSIDIFHIIYFIMF